MIRPRKAQTPARKANSRPQTFHDVRHELNKVWTLMHFDEARGKRWEEQAMLVGEFRSPQDVFSMVGFFSPTSLGPGMRCTLFKSSITSKLDHPANKYGGYWLTKVRKNEDGAQIMKGIIREMISCSMHGDFGVNDVQVCGLIVESAKVEETKEEYYEIELWTRDYELDRPVLDIGQTVKEHVLKNVTGSEGFQMCYFAHEFMKSEGDPWLYKV